MSDSAISKMRQVHSRFADLTTRERVLILVAGLVVVLFGGFFVLIDPLHAEIRDAQQRVEQLTQRQQTLQQQLSVVKQDLRLDPNQTLQSRIASVEAQIQALDATMQAQIYNLVPADAMPVVLEQVLAESSGITLVSLLSLPPQRMFEASQKQQLQDAAGLYQHGVRLTLRGSYFDVQQYLAKLEQLPWDFYWKRLNYGVDQYPDADVQVEIYTLSPSQAFMGVKNHD